MSRRLLIADDDALFCKLLQYSLEQAGLNWEIDTAGSGKEAVEAIHQNRPDVMVLDLKMPDGDGYSVLEAHRSAGHAFPVLVATHLPASEHEDRCKTLGAAALVRKAQIRMTQFVAMIEQTVAA